MLKDFAWNVFKNTGNINTFLEFKNLEDNINYNEINKNVNDNIGGFFGNYKDKRNSN